MGCRHILLAAMSVLGFHVAAIVVPIDGLFAVVFFMLSVQWRAQPFLTVKTSCRYSTQCPQTRMISRVKCLRGLHRRCSAHQWFVVCSFTPHASRQTSFSHFTVCAHDTLHVYNIICTFVCVYMSGYLHTFTHT